MNAPADRGHNGPAAIPSWQELEPAIPAIVATMLRYLEQIGCILRPGSVRNTDQALLRAVAGFLAQTAPEVTSLGQVTRRHIEDYNPCAVARQTSGNRRPLRTGFVCSASTARKGSSSTRHITARL